MHWLKTYLPRPLRWYRTGLPMAISLPMALAAALLLVGINETGYDRSANAVRSIAAAQETRAHVYQMLLRVLDAETGLRGFLLSGDERYLEPYNAAVSDINQRVDVLRHIYAPQSPDNDALTLLTRHLSRKLAEMDLSLKLRRQGDTQAWKSIMLTDIGKVHMDAIREQSKALIDQATAQMNDGERQVRESLLLSRLGIAGTALIGLAGFYLYLRQSNALKLAGDHQQQALEEERDRLETLVRERTASLAKLATHLQNVRENERAHLARELHDELGALLTAAKLDVARIKSRLGDSAPEALQRLQHLTDTLNCGIALKRRIVEDLRPSSLSNLGLLPSLEILAQEFSQRTDIAVDVHLEPVQLEESAQLTLYRLVQESLTNIGKYAKARQVHIQLLNQESQARLEVGDDGVGFDPTCINPSSHGLDGMRHRVETEGGRLIVSSSPGQGSLIVAQLPLALHAA